MVENMSVTDKINALEACVAKCEDIEYSVRAKLGDNKEEKLSEIRVVIQNGRKLFNANAIQQLDIDVRNEAFRTWHTKLNKYLALFPEYSLEQEERTRTM